MADTGRCSRAARNRSHNRFAVEQAVLRKPSAGSDPYTGRVWMSVWQAGRPAVGLPRRYLRTVVRASSTSRSAIWWIDFPWLASSCMVCTVLLLSMAPLSCRPGLGVGQFFSAILGQYYLGANSATRPQHRHSSRRRWMRAPSLPHVSRPTKQRVIRFESFTLAEKWPESKHKRSDQRLREPFSQFWYRPCGRERMCPVCVGLGC